MLDRKVAENENAPFLSFWRTSGVAHNVAFRSEISAPAAYLPPPRVPGGVTEAQRSRAWAAQAEEHAHTSGGLPPAAPLVGGYETAWRRGRPT
jgi:hypothetical protein